jgi:hypothetical protein
MAMLISVGAHWLALASTYQPFYNAWGAYATDPTKPTTGLSSPDFLASFAFYFLTMAIMCFIYLICSIRTNVFFVILFMCLVVGFSCLAGQYWQGAKGNIAMAGTLQKTAGAFLFVVCACGWWLFFAQMLAALDFPFQIPGKRSSGLYRHNTNISAQLATFQACSRVLLNGKG